FTGEGVVNIGDGEAGPGSPVTGGAVQAVAAPLEVGSLFVEGKGKSEAEVNLKLNGVIDGPGSFTITKSLNWTGGVMKGSGSTLIDSEAIALIDGQFVNRLMERTLINDGSVIGLGTDTAPANPVPPGLVVSGKGEIINFGFFQTQGFFNLEGKSRDFLNLGTFSVMEGTTGGLLGTT